MPGKGDAAANRIRADQIRLHARLAVVRSVRERKARAAAWAHASRRLGAGRPLG